MDEPAQASTAERLARMRAHVGEVLQTVVMPVEAGKVAEFARALHDPNPVYTDVAVATQQGFPHIPAPPTFTTVVAHFPAESMTPRSPAAAAVACLGFDRTRTVNGTQRWEYHRTPVVGDVLTARSVLTEVTSRPRSSGGEMIVATVRTEFRDQRDQPVVTDTVTILELPERER